MLPKSCQAVVVVPMHNERSFIEATLRELMGQCTLDGVPLRRESFAIVTVDDSSSDQTARVVESVAAKNPDLHLTVLKSRGRGVAWARRTGMDWAADQLKGLPSPRRFLFSTDADTLVHPQWIAKAIARFDAEPRLSFLGGEFVFSAPFTAGLRRLRRYASAWQTLKSVLGPLSYVETVGSNFVVDVETYGEIGGVPLLTVGEDLAVAELALAAGKSGGYLPVANQTSERRAAGDPIEFLTGGRRFEAWGSHGVKEFQPCRSNVPVERAFDAITAEGEQQIIRSCLRYFARQHVIKPLVLISRFRAPVLDRLGISVAAFEQAIDRAELEHPDSEPFHLEDRILHVDAQFHRAVFDSLLRLVESASRDAETPPLGDVPFHLKAVNG